MKLSALVFLFLSLIPSHLGAVELWGVDIDGFEVQGGLAWFQNSVQDSAPDPIVMTAGISVPFRFLSYYTFRPEAQFFLQTYGFEKDRAIPLEPMFDSVLFLTWILNPAFGFEYPITKEWTLGTEISLTFFNRFPVFFLGTGGNQALAATGWFYAGRFLFPAWEVHGIWQFSELFAVTIRSSLYYPIFNLWAGAPWWDQLGLGINFGLRFKL